MEKKRPFARARPRGGPPLTGLAEILAREKRQPIVRKPPTPTSDDEEFHPDSVIISTPKLPTYNNNLRSRPVDELLREQEIEESRRVERKGFRAIQSIEREVDPIKDATANETPRPTVSFRPSHQREDSMALLRKLSRVASVSPRQDSKDQDRAKHTMDAKPAPRDTNMESRYPDPQPARSALEAVVPKFREQREYGESTIGSLEDIMRRNTEDTADEIDSVDKHQADGAKPQITDDKPSNVRSTQGQQPKSALDEVVKEAKQEPQADESMIASLENIINPITEQSNSNLTPGVTPIKEDDDIDIDGPLSQLEKDRRQERLALENLNKRLQSTRTTIKDANRGLRRIENRIEEVEATNADITIAEDVAQSAKPAPLPQPNNTLPAAPVSFTTILNHNGRTICTHCGGGYHSVWRALWTEFRENFYTYDTTASDRIHITWLGWTVVCWFIWLFLETGLATQYSDYLYGPVFPFVTFNLSVRPFLPILRPFFSFLAWSFGSLFNLLFGEVAASNKPPRATPSAPSIVTNWGYEGTRTTAFISATTSRAIRSTVEALDEIGRIWDDDLFIN